MDDADRAEILEQHARELAINAARRQTDASLPGRTHCIDCGFDIEPQRQRLGGVIRCGECQGFYNQEQRQKGFLR